MRVRFSADGVWIHVAAWLALLAGVAWPLANAATAEEQGQTVVHLLDYVGVDYPACVRDGQVLSPSEYAEQREFTGQAVALLDQLPEVSGKSSLLEEVRRLQARIEVKAEGPEVTALASIVRADVIRVYGLTVAPREAPDLRRGARLFETDCSACHGAQGRGDGVAGQALDPKPSNFHDAARMDQRSVYGLYNTVTLGVSGTPMRAFTELSDSDRWALAFFVGNLRSSADELARGNALWQRGQGKSEIGSFRALVTSTRADVLRTGGVTLAAVQAYIIANPQVVQAATPAPLDVARAKLDEALQAYRTGDHESARQLAVASYLDGFELIEASLDNVDTPLRIEAERQMMALRSSIAAGQPTETVAGQVQRIEALLGQANDKLSGGSLSPATAFASSLLILLREGLEAILVLAAIIAFVLKTGRRDALPYIHVGWLAALVLGLLTWVVARYLLTISGANRELTEGFTALIAAAMLLYVGYWLHSKSYAQAWQAFIRDQVTAALGKRTLWAMAGISFLAVYRELFEIILFYEALWAQAGPGARHAVLGGIAAAAILLALLGGFILKYSVRLPIGPFFAATSGLLALLAVVFAGNGIAALQEAGVVDATAAHFVSVPLLGIHPTTQGLLAQGAAVALVLIGLMIARRADAQ
jgi:high-affinity iron transporter